MGTEHKIPRRKNQEIYTLTIGNKVMINDLLKLGLTPNKSLDIKFPILDQGLYGHFIRGYFDGDSSIYLCNNAWRISFVSGSKEFLISLNTVLVNYAGIMGRPIYISSNSRAHILIYLKRVDLKRTFNFIYNNQSIKNGTFLARKYERFVKCADPNNAI